MLHLNMLLIVDISTFSLHYGIKIIFPYYHLSYKNQLWITYDISAYILKLC